MHPRLPLPTARRLHASTLALLTLAVVVLTAAPATAVTVGASYRPPQVLLHFDRQEVRRIADAANTGFTAFLGAVCSLIPGGRRLAPVQVACATGASVGYGRLVPIFRDAQRRGRCVRVSYPPLFPVPNPAPYSRVEACR